MKHHHKHTSRRGDHSKKSLRSLFWIALILIISLIVLYFVGSYLENQGQSQTFGDLEGRFETVEPVVYQNQSYLPKTNIDTYLFIGVDKREDAIVAENDPNQYRNGGQSDFLLLMIIDHDQKTIERIQIDRDTMTPITVLGVFGNDLGTNIHQICLSHGFGDGMEQSCQYTVEAVSRLLFGTSIDGYISLDMGGIAELNDLLGGITVTLSDDFSAYDETMIPGATITLQGEQAEIFVRYRMLVGDGTNAERMVRQKLFLSMAGDKISEEIKANANFVGTLFDGLTDCLVTDLSKGKLINDANKAGNYTVEDIVSPAGEHTIGSDGFVEFHVDEDALMQLVFDTFYTLVS